MVPSRHCVPKKRTLGPRNAHGRPIAASRAARWAGCCAFACRNQCAAPCWAICTAILISRTPRGRFGRSVGRYGQRITRSRAEPTPMDPNLQFAWDAEAMVPRTSRRAIPCASLRATPREFGHQPEPFESWFELDMFLRIARRGYRAIPQFKVGGFRIDLVVQGRDGSPAVECDGDHWHGPDRYEQDAARQRDLERCGWTFWRVRESVFRFALDKALSSLWETLRTHSIFPETGAVQQRGGGETTGSPANSIDAESTEQLPSGRLRIPIKSDGPAPLEEPTGETTPLKFH